MTSAELNRWDCECTFTLLRMMVHDVRICVYYSPEFIGCFSALETLQDPVCRLHHDLQLFGSTLKKECPFKAGFFFNKICVCKTQKDHGICLGSCYGQIADRIEGKWSYIWWISSQE